METKIEDGIEYVRGLSGYWVKLYTLDNGKKITVNELSLKISCSTVTARARLKRISDPKKIFANVRKTKNKGEDRVDTNNWINGKTWYKDPLVKLMLKSPNANP
jgi:hypothetical protein